MDADIGMLLIAFRMAQCARMYMAIPAVYIYTETCVCVYIYIFFFYLHTHTYVPFLLCAASTRELSPISSPT